MSDVNINFPPAAAPTRAVTAGEVEDMVIQAKADVEGQVSAVVGQVDAITSQVEDMAINIKEFGAVGDAVLVDVVYTLPNGRQIQSKEWKGTNNKTAFESALSSGRKIFIPKGNYYVSGDVFITNLNNIIFEGAGKHETKFINGRFRMVDSNTIYFNNIGFYGKGNKLAPDKPLTMDSAKQLDQNYFWWLDYVNIGYSAYGIRTDTPTTDNVTFDIQVNNCHFEMREGCLATGRNADGTGKFVNNIKMVNCSSDHMWWHGFGGAYARNVVVDKCDFKYHFIGMMVDFSSGTDGSIMTNCTGYKVSCMFKAESYDATIGINNNCKIVNNTYESFGETENNLKQYCFKTAGNNTIIENNTIVINDNYREVLSLYGENTHAAKNKFYINGTIVVFLNQYGNMVNKPSFKLVDNDIFLTKDITSLIEISNVTLPLSHIGYSLDARENRVYGDKEIQYALNLGQVNKKIETIKFERNSMNTKKVLWLKDNTLILKQLSITGNVLGSSALNYQFDVLNVVGEDIVIKNNTFKYKEGFLATNSTKVNMIRFTSCTLKKVEIDKNSIQLNSTFIELVSTNSIDRFYITDNELVIDGTTFAYDFILGTALTNKLGIFKNNTILGDALKNQTSGSEISKTFDFKTWFYDENNKYIGIYNKSNAKV